MKKWSGLLEDVTLAGSSVPTILPLTE